MRIEANARVVDHQNDVNVDVFEEEEDDDDYDDGEVVAGQAAGAL